MKTTFLSTILFLCLWSNITLAERSIYLVRHAEKQADGTANPSLTKQGLQRANNLAQQLKDKNIVAVYSTSYNRTQQTAAPLAKLLGLDVQTYDPRKLLEFAETVLRSDQTILIVGHSNTTPSMVTHLGGDSFGDIDESVYDRLYHLRFSKDEVESMLLKSTSK